MSQSLPTLTEDPSSWKDASLLSVTQITAPGLKYLCSIAQSMRDLVRSKGGDNRLENRILATVFYEASTRTSCSFQAAMQRLGGTFIHVDGQGNSSAAKKKESLSDTIRCLECYTDVTVLRHPQTGSVAKVIEKCAKPVLNAGDGVGEHPTQALLDVFTIFDELNLATGKRPLTVVLLGDLKHGRTVHSLARLLTTCGLWEESLTLRYVSPTGLEMPQGTQDSCKQPGVNQAEFSSLEEACQGADVLYVTRVQRERFESEEAYEKVKVRSTPRSLKVSSSF